MAKIRGIKPEFWTDSRIVGLKIPTRLFFIGLWNFCDDNGVFEWNPLELKMKIFPADDIDTTSALRDLVESTCVSKFQYKNKFYGIIPRFAKHQRPDKRFLVTLISTDELAKINTLVETTTRPPRDHHDDSEVECDGEVDIKPPLIPPKRGSRIFKKEDFEHIQWESICHRLEELGLVNQVNPVLYLKTIDEFSARGQGVRQEVNDCLFWCKNKGLKSVTVPRIRNWLKNWAKKMKEQELKKLSSNQDKKFDKENEKKKEREKLWQPPA